MNGKFYAASLFLDFFLMKLNINGASSFFHGPILRTDALRPEDEGRRQLVKKTCV